SRRPWEGQAPPLRAITVEPRDRGASAVHGAPPGCYGTVSGLVFGPRGDRSLGLPLVLAAVGPLLPALPCAPAPGHGDRAADPLLAPVAAHRHRLRARGPARAHPGRGRAAGHAAGGGHSARGPGRPLFPELLQGPVR